MSRVASARTIVADFHSFAADRNTPERRRRAPSGAPCRPGPSSSRRAFARVSYLSAFGSSGSHSRYGIEATV
jgi:hypothetical protein